VAVVPPPGAKYDVDTKKVVIDETLIDIAECEDERTATIYTKIANNVLPGILMAFDVPNTNIRYGGVDGWTDRRYIIPAL
jgi:hypothetical protein